MTKSAGQAIRSLIALGLMAAIGAIPPDALSGFTVLGELGLDGSIAPVAAIVFC